MMVPFLFVGFDVIPQAAEELRIPRRSIGALLLTAVALAALWYAVVAASVALAFTNPILYGYLNENFRKEYKNIYR